MPIVGIGTGGIVMDADGPLNGCCGGVGRDRGQKLTG